MSLQVFIQVKRDGRKGAAPEDTGESVDGVVAHAAQQVLPGVDGAVSAELAEGGVSGQADLAVALQVEGGQVDAVTLADLAEQHGGHLGRDKVVEGQRRLVGHSQEVLVEHARLVQVERLPDQVRERRVRDVAVLFAPALHVGRKQRVAEAEGGRCERGQDARIDGRVVAVPVALQHTIGLGDVIAIGGENEDRS